MATTFDVFNPQVSKVIRGLGGKVITIYGKEGTGKSYQCSKMSKPLFICFEEGMGAIGGIQKLPVETWADFIKYNKQLTSKTTVDKARTLYDTVILDSIDAMENICLEYVCLQAGVRALGDIPHGAGYKIYETTFWKEINKITKAGYTLVFIGHPVTNSEGFTTIKGDQKRTVEPITSRSDVVAYLCPNGVDDSGKPLHSSAWLCQTQEAFARSRFTEIIPYIDDYTAGNLEAAIIQAIEREEKLNGSENMASFEEYAAETETTKESYNDLMNELRSIGNLFVESDKMDDLTYIVEQHLGKGEKATALKKGQEAIIEAILMDLKEFAETEIKIASA